MSWWEAMLADLERDRQRAWLEYALHRAWVAAVLPRWRLADMLEHCREVRELEDHWGYVEPWPVRTTVQTPSRPAIDLSYWNGPRPACPPGCEFCGPTA